jgi:hypothetical protein
MTDGSLYRTPRRGILVPLEEIPYVVRSLSCSWVGAVADADIRPTLIFLAGSGPPKRCVGYIYRITQQSGSMRAKALR